MFISTKGEWSEGQQNETVLSAGDEVAFYRFIPKTTGTYHFYSIDSGDTYGAIYDAQKNLIKEASDDGKEGVDFSIEAELAENQTYYLGVDYYLDVDSGKITWLVEEEKKNSGENFQTEVEEKQPEENGTAQTEDTSEAANTEMSNESEEVEQSADVSEQDQNGNIIQNPEMYFYQLNSEGTGLVITGNFGAGSDLVIPETLEYNGKVYPVTEIGDGAYRYCTSITTVTISKNLEKIGSNAFASCYGICNVDFSKAENLRVIEENAFNNDSFLTSITIPSTVTTIGQWAFGSCSAVTNVDLTNATSLKTIGIGAFQGVRIDHIFIPENVEKIGNSAFNNSLDPSKTFYVYGTPGTGAERYCQEKHWRIEFRDKDGIYLEKPYAYSSSKDTAWETGNATYQLVVSWPEQNSEQDIKWSSSNEAIATVDKNGLVTRGKKGIVTITASLGNYKDSVRVRFSAPSVTSEDGLWQYSKLSDGTAALTGYNGGSENKVTMPDTVDGYKVTKICRFYVQNWDNVGMFILPKTVKQIESKTFWDYSGDIIIPEENSLEYIGSDAFNSQVYGPEDFALKGYWGRYPQYRIDKKVYLSQRGRTVDDNGNVEYYLIHVDHIPSEISGAVQWTSSDPDQKICYIEKRGTDDTYIQVMSTKQENGTVTITASTPDGKHTASLDLEFKEALKTSSDGQFVYRITDKEKKKATITKCVKRDAEQMVIPEQIDGYTVTGIGDAENEYNGYIYAKTFIIPDSVNTIKDNVLKSSTYGKCVIIGKKNSESEHYAKRNSKNAIFATEDQIVLNTNKESEWIDEASETNRIINLEVLYVPSNLSAEKRVWTSSNKEVATVDEGGTVTVSRAGESTITLTCGNQNAQCVITAGKQSDGFYYKDLADGTVEILGMSRGMSSTVNISSTLDDKKVTVIGTDAFGDSRYANIRIPDGVTTIRRHAFESEYGNMCISVPESVKNIDSRAIDNTVGTYTLYGIKGSAAEKYAEENDKVTFVEDGLKTAIEWEDFKPTEHLMITQLPLDVDKEQDIITWTSSNLEVVSVKYGDDFEEAMTATYKTLTDDAVNVEVTCRVGKYTATIPITINSTKEVKSGDYTYVNNGDGTICVTEYAGDAQNLNIPDKIDGKTVQSIAGFARNDDLESVIIPKTVTEIEYGTFSNCMNLSQVLFENGSKLKTIGASAFSGCGIAKIQIPNNVTQIGGYAFAQCMKLTTVTLSNQLEGINFGTFSGCLKLDKITIPESVSYIEESAFAKNNLTSIIIPKSVTSIGAEAFINNKNLSDITIKNKKAYIDAAAFAECAVESLELSQNIGGQAFADNKELKTVTLKEGVTTIAYGAFSGCENLEKVTFPKSLKQVNVAAFDGTKWYENQPDGPVYANNIVFSCKGTPETVVIKNGTTRICRNAFYDCRSLEKIVIPATVKAIDKNAIGYMRQDWETGKDLNLVIAGVKGSEAERYAKENGFTFEEMVYEITDEMVRLAESEYAYTGKAIIPMLTVKDGEVELKQGIDYKVTYKDNMDVGKATVTIEGMGAYSGTVEKNSRFMNQIWLLKMWIRMRGISSM